MGYIVRMDRQTQVLYEEVDRVRKQHAEARNQPRSEHKR